MMWYRGDAVGTSLYAVDAEGEVIAHAIYDPWGNPLTETKVDMNYTGLEAVANFTGYTWDETLGLYFAQNRFYDPDTHRFTQKDEAEDGTNWYVYAQNDPVMYVDPDGLGIVSGIKKAAGAVKKAASSAKKKVTTTVKKAAAGVKKQATAVANKVTNTAKKAQATVSNAAKKVTTAVKKTAAQVKNTVSTKVNAAANAVKTKAAEIKKRTVTTITISNTTNTASQAAQKAAANNKKQSAFDQAATIFKTMKTDLPYMPLMICNPAKDKVNTRVLYEWYQQVEVDSRSRFAAAHSEEAKGSNAVSNMAYKLKENAYVAVCLGTAWHFEIRKNLNGVHPTYGEVEDEENGWRLLRPEQSKLHDNKIGAMEEKYDKTSGKEAVFDGDTHEIMTDPRYIGTFNYSTLYRMPDDPNVIDYVNLISSYGGHGVVDVLPYLITGGSNTREQFDEIIGW